MRDTSINTRNRELARYLSAEIQLDINTGMLINMETGSDFRNGMVPVEVFQ